MKNSNMPPEKEFVTMSVLKEMLELQQNSFKVTIKVVVDGLKSEREIRQEQEELKLSVKFFRENMKIRRSHLRKWTPK